MEDKECPHGDTGKAEAVIPFGGIAQISDREDGENRMRDDLLNGLQPRTGECLRAKPVRWDLKAIIEQSDAPTGEDDLPKR
jgi:hypothetical protein